GGGGWGGAQQGGDFGDIINDIFGSFFGGGGRRESSNSQRAGQNLKRNVNLTFRESVFGTKKTFELDKQEVCPSCHGTGAASPSDIVTCSRCRGQGKVYVTQQSIFGTVRQETICPDCHGRGKTIRNKCNTCRGQGLVGNRVKKEVEFPQGIATGNQIRLAGFGGPGENGGPSGDLYLFVTVENHRYFKREKNDAILEVPISFPQAALGATLDIPTPYETNERIKIEPGVQHGTMYKIKNKGFKDVNNRVFGDLIVIISIKTPNKLSRSQTDLYNQLSAVDDGVFFKFKDNFKS
ncbi:MAG: J domain-containing protein, partial [Bacillales bacterium]|nr:J domain-containing protein [Bacillales bacterium]